VDAQLRACLPNQLLLTLFCNVHYLQIRPFTSNMGGSSVAAQATNPNIYVTVEIWEPKAVDGGEPEEPATVPTPPPPKRMPGSVQVQQTTKTVVDALVVYTPKRQQKREALLHSPRQ
jgi:hypothetical protein